MELDANTYLTTQILNDGKLVSHRIYLLPLLTSYHDLKISYRALSRYLGVHSNIAKQ